ncbi:MAG: PAS domain S-box protein [Myxococcota bacterium]
MDSTQAFELLVRHMTVGLVVWQCDADGRSLRLVCANAAASGFLRFDLNAHVGKTLREVFPTIPEERYTRYLELACSPRSSDDKPVRFADEVSQHTTFSVRAVAMPERCVGIILQDVSEESSLLAEREKRFRALLEHSMDAIVATDAQARIIYTSQAFGRILGYAPYEVIGAEGFPLVHPDDRERSRAEFARMLSRPGEPIKNQIRIMHRDGSWRWVEVVTVNRLDEPGVWAAVSNFRDITEQLKTEAALRKAEEQLQHALKMEAVGRLAGGVAHDFNNLLTIVLSCSEMLLSDPKAAYAHEELSEIKRAGERAAELTRQLLAFSRKQVLEPKIIDLNHTISGVLRLVHRMVGESVRVRFNPSPELWLTRLDPDQLVQVLLNLVANARDAMPTGGTLSIETSNFMADAEHARAHINVSPGPYVALAVTDNGTGMDRDTRARIFEPFFTTKEAGKGTGLGLSMVHGIVEQSGGSIWVYSEVGIGTTFKLYFPRADVDAAFARESINAGAEPATLAGTETILIVDDDASVRGVARSILQKQGYTVITAASGQEALWHATHTGDIHLLITDVVMPDTNGPQLARKLREVHPTSKVLFISGYADGSVLHEGLSEHASRYLQKPLTLSTFARKVRQLLDEEPPRDAEAAP